MQLSRIILLSGVVFPGLAVAAPEMPRTSVPMEQCLAAVLKVAGGKVEYMKLEVEAGRAIYEFRIEGDDDHDWEAECDANTGEIVEMQREVSRQDPAFNQAAKVIESDARRIAAERQPGKVVESERKLDYRGRPVYEVEIASADGRKIEVDVDAVSGQILEVEDESAERTVYEIGD